MTKLPVISGKKLIKVLTKFGYYIRDQKGSHVHLRHPIRKPLTVPAHKTIARGTLRAIIRDADLTVDEFLQILEEI
ncbi:MAG: type II toxin-antitoxin system HicA family toxin [Thermoplasmata archaeon]|nr:MAG: type II toxin-antitoxin system HicA family toxin [Thermoplasmata archaeon]